MYPLYYFEFGQLVKNETVNKNELIIQKKSLMNTNENTDIKTKKKKERCEFEWQLAESAVMVCSRNFLFAN